MTSINEKQRKVLADFYSNFALAWLTFGLITPIFVGMGNPVVFVAKLLVSLAGTIGFLKISLDFAK